jgi:hypothetical protein
MAVLTRMTNGGRRGAPWPRAARWLLLAVLALLAALPRARAQPAPPLEYQVKATFLFKLAQFVEWPAAAFADPKAPFILGVLGDDPFGGYLDELVKGEKIGERAFVVRRFHRPEETTACHVLFISHTETSALERDFAQLKRRSVLTVGEADAFTRLGGMVRFAIEEGKVHLKINPEAAKFCDLIISSKILTADTIVGPGRE